MSLSIVEFQLLNDVNHGIVGRLYSPRPLDTRNSTRVILSAQRSGRVVIFKTTAEDHLSLYETCAHSNITANRMRTDDLISQIRREEVNPMDYAASPVTFDVPEAGPEMPPASEDLTYEAALPSDPEPHVVLVESDTKPTTQDGLSAQLQAYDLKSLRQLCTQLGAAAKGKTKAKLINRIIHSEDDSRLFDYYLNIEDTAAA